ncbi:hypothetical protein ANN_00242 [Periplaneta americana]|uniref:Tc1-like transposase DDE domain-containing protein n=1 Tax=Periplaneta americana TaxID=6978 RepID=A0ABQ8TRV9_PERAM|nr:hypothetical protein ANN_00242 [Periplaneta americana]
MCGIQSTLQKSVVHVYNELKKEDNEEGIMLTETAITTRIGKLLGLGFTTVTNVRNSQKGTPLVTPGKHRLRKHPVTDADDFTKDAIARFIYDKLHKGEVSSDMNGVIHRPTNEGGRLDAGTKGGFILDWLLPPPPQLGYRGMWSLVAGLSAMYNELSSGFMEHCDTYAERSLPSKETLRGHSDSSFRGEGYIQCCVGVRLCDMYSNQELAEIHFMCLRGRPRSTTPEVQEEILEAVNMTPSISTQRVALQVNVPHTTVWRLLKEYQLCGSPSTCIIGDRLVGPHVLVNRLTGQAYTNFLENTIPHVLEDTPLINRQHIHFLHDGTPAHFSRTARRYLDRRFPDRWIGRGGPVAWPPRSPDLNPLDFYLWGHLKSLVYSSPVPDLESLRNRIVACCEDIRNTPGVWDRVRRSMRHRCEVCIQAGGGHFEHLL